MKAMFGLGALLFIGILGWQVGEQLSSDAIGMALGVLFGIVAGIPAALMVLAAKRVDNSDRVERRRTHGRDAYGAYPLPQQPPVIVVTGQGSPPAGQAGGYGQPYGAPLISSPAQMNLAGQPSSGAERHFRVVGEEDDSVDSW